MFDLVDEWNDANKTMTDDKDDNGETQEEKTEEVDTPRQDEAKEEAKEEQQQQEKQESSENQEQETEGSVKSELRSVDSQYQFFFNIDLNIFIFVDFEILKGDDWEKDFELGSDKDSEKPVTVRKVNKAEATEKLEKALSNNEEKGEVCQSFNYFNIYFC